MLGLGQTHTHRTELLVFADKNAMKRQLLAPENFDAEPVFAASPQPATDFEPDPSSGEDESEQLRLKMRELAACTGLWADWTRPGVLQNSIHRCVF